jgi:hypothetical protein
MAQRAILFDNAENNLATDTLRWFTYFGQGDATGSGVIRKADGHWQVVEDSPASMDVVIIKGAGLLKDNNSNSFLRKSYIGELDADTTVTITSNATGSNRVDAIVAYIDLNGSSETRGEDVLQFAAALGDGTSALTDSEVQTRVDALVSGYTDVPWTRISNVTVPDSAASITNTDIVDTRVQVELGSPRNGWIADTDTWVYVSASSFKIEGSDVTATFPPCTRIRYKQGGSYGYGTVTGAAFSTDTTVTLAANDDYALADAAITDAGYSYGSCPQGYPKKFTFTPAGDFITVGNGTIAGNYSIVNGRCFCEIIFTLGSTSAVAAGAGFRPPTPCHADMVGHSVGFCRMYEDGSSSKNGQIYINTTTRFRWAANNTSGSYAYTDLATADIPFTWDTDDQCYASFNYLMA